MIKRKTTISRNHGEMAPIDRLSEKYIPEPMSGCWIWKPCLNHNGYGSFWFGGRNIGAHRASWLIHKGAIPGGLHVLHKCDVRCCVNPDHMFIGTSSDNSADMLAKGRSGGPSGEKNTHAKLSEDDVRSIRSLANHHSAEFIADSFGITKHHCQSIISRRRWVHI